MHNREDLFIKAILATAMSRAGKAEIELQVVPPAAQRIDVYSEPDPALAGELAEMGTLGEVGAEPAAFEPFSETPGLRQMRACYRKQLVWHHELERRARVAAGDTTDEDKDDKDDKEPSRPVPFPVVVVLSPGRPQTVLDAYGFAEVSPGLHRLPAGFAVWLLVLSELPKTRATVLLRLGSEKLRAAAAAEILRMPADAWERKTAEPLLVQYGLEPSRSASPEEKMTLAEIQQEVEEGRQKLRHEGQQQGERRFLLRQLRARFGELPPAVVARVEAAEPEVLEAWGEQVLTARSLDEVFGGA
jgi:hypothetical protein